jgi:hypothetical protein
MLLARPPSGRLRIAHGLCQCAQLAAIPTALFASVSSPAAFRAHWKGNLDEMRQMGFATGWCNRHRYLNFANNQFTDRYLRFLREETPVRAVRSWTGSCFTGRCRCPTYDGRPQLSAIHWNDDTASSSSIPYDPLLE